MALKKKSTEAHFSPLLGSSVLIISDLSRITIPFQWRKAVFGSSETWLTSVSPKQGEEKNEMIKHDKGIKSECGELSSSPVTKRKSQFKIGSA